MYLKICTGKRHLKTQLSNKINPYCPAAIKKTTDKTNNTIKVTFTKTHMGHEQDLGHLFLSLTERQSIAKRIALKIPLSSILDEIRDSVNNSELERLHLLTRKDLYNIESSYNLNSTSVRHKNHGVSADSWAREMQDNKIVLF